MTVRDFLSLLDTQVLGPDDLVRIEGETRWTAAKNVTEQLRHGRWSSPPAPASKRPSSAVPVGGHTVFTSAPHIQKAAVPRELATSPGAHCGQCGTAVHSDAVFCKSCGVRLSPRRCSACQHDNDADARFCEQCGTRLPAGVLG